MQKHAVTEGTITRNLVMPMMAEFRAVCPEYAEENCLKLEKTSFFVDT